VAKQAGVSAQTVSRVINERHDVAPETRQRVLEIAQQMGYQRSELARSLAQRRSYTLGVVIAGLQYIGSSRTLNGITTKAEELGYALLLKELPHFTTNEIRPLIRFLLARHIDGILWAVPEIGDNHAWVDESFASIPVPVVFITMEARLGIPVVSIDNFLGGTLATQHLLEQGCRHIGHIAGPLDWWEARRRKKGWQDAIMKAGLAVEDRHFVEGTGPPRAGRQPSKSYRRTTLKWTQCSWRTTRWRLLFCILPTASRSGSRRVLESLASTTWLKLLSLVLSSQ
jgi:Transcriptional regulators